jgi:surface carbohydrate biosynthesis protein
MSERPLLLPVETLNREFDAKLLLALHAAERGWQPVIGKYSAVNNHIRRFERSVYFSKGLRSENGPTFRIVNGLGHAIVGLDEESLVNTSDDMLLLRMDSKVLRPVRMAFAWGANDARVFGLAEGLNGKPIIPSGNPRIDLLRPELGGFFAAEVAKIRERFGRFAMLNTNFAMVNHFLPNQTRFRVAKWVPSETAMELKSGLLGHKAKLLGAFLDLLPRLSEALKPDVLVVRPHPSENWQTWRDAVRGLENVHVIHEGSIGTWLTAANVLIHNGCTSAVEAAILGTPALSYRPFKANGYDNDLPNGLSLEFEDADGLIAEAVAKTRAGSNAQPELDANLDSARRALLDGHVSALSGPLACERLLDAIEQNTDILQPGAGPFTQSLTRVRHRAHRIYRNLGKSSERTGKPQYRRHKFPKTQATDIDARIARFQAALGRFDGYHAEQIRPKIFRIVRG